MSIPPMNLYVRLSIGPVRQEDVDALLLALDAPLAKGEGERARAEVLHRLVNDPALGELRGHDGRRLDVTAVHALHFMGRAYGEDLSEKALRLLEQFPPAPVPLQPAPPPAEPVAPVAAPAPVVAPAPAAFPRWQRDMGHLGMAWGVIEICLFLLATEVSMTKFSPGLLLFLSLPTALTLLLPARLLCLTHLNTGIRILLVLYIPLFLMAVPVCLFLAVIALPGTSKAAAHDSYSLTVIAVLVGLVVRLLLIIPIIAALGRRT